MPLPEEQALAQPVCGAAYLQSSTAAGKAANFGCRLSGASNAEEQARFEAEAARRAEQTAQLGGAIGVGDAKHVSQLLQSRADPNQSTSLPQPRGGGGPTLPLCAAALLGKTSVASALLAFGADANGRDGDGMTALHHAACYGQPELVRLLLGAGALATLADERGRLPLELATDVGVREMLAPSRSSLGGGDDDDDDDDDDDQSARIEPARPSGAGAGAGAGAGGADGVAATPKDTSVSYPTLPGGEPSTSPEQLDLLNLVAELQLLLNSHETEPKRLLTLPKGIGGEVQCDVLRTSISPMSYRCYLRLGGSAARRICIFEAVRSRKGKLANSHYRIQLPNDRRLLPSDAAYGTAYCGKMRSKNLSGANFVCYDDGHKVGQHAGQRAAAGQPRRQMGAVVFNKATSRRAPMSMRALVPSVGLAGRADAAGLELLDTLQALGADPGGGLGGGAVHLPGGTELLRLAPPRWNEEGQMYQLSYEGRACCMSNKNVQLANAANDKLPTLQVGKLQKNLFNMDLGGCISPFQAFAIALSVFEQSSVRRRF